MAKKKRKPVKCESCGFDSWDGRVCRGCKKYYGSAEDAIAGSALAREMANMTYDQVVEKLASMVDLVVYDWPGPSLPRLLYSDGVGGADRRDRQG